MPTVEERYVVATAYVRRAVDSVEIRGIVYAVHPVTGVIEWYAGKTKTEPYRNELSRIEARWLRAPSDSERAKIAREAELLADRTQETLPGAPQDRQRTNLWNGEEATETPSTSFYGEVADQAALEWNWIKEKASGVASGAMDIGKWLLIGGGIVLGWKVFDYLGERERRLEVRSAGTTRRLLNANLERAATHRDARPRARRSKPARRLRLDDTELHTWFERDRAHVDLRDSSSGETIIEWWDEEVHQAIEDGFLPDRWTDASAQRAAFDYAEHLGLIEEARDAGSSLARRAR